jgi:hypothetical protein
MGRVDSGVLQSFQDQIGGSTRFWAARNASTDGVAKRFEKRERAASR